MYCFVEVDLRPFRRHHRNLLHSRGELHLSNLKLLYDIRPLRVGHDKREGMGFPGPQSSGYRARGRSFVALVLAELSDCAFVGRVVEPKRGGIK